MADPGHGALSVVVAERHPHGASRDGTYLHRDDVIASVGQVLDAAAVLDDLHHESEYEMLANRLRAKLDELGLEIL